MNYFNFFPGEEKTEKRINYTLFLYLIAVAALCYYCFLFAQGFLEKKELQRKDAYLTLHLNDPALLAALEDASRITYRASGLKLLNEALELTDDVLADCRLDAGFLDTVSRILGGSDKIRLLSADESTVNAEAVCASLQKTAEIERQLRECGLFSDVTVTIIDKGEGTGASALMISCEMTFAGTAAPRNAVSSFAETNTDDLNAFADYLEKEAEQSEEH